MNTMEITKFVGAACGSLLVFLMLVGFSGAVFDTHSDKVVFVVELPDATTATDASPVEEETAEGIEVAQASGGDVDVAALVAAGDVEKGKTVFKKCAACHKVDGKDGVGPHLNGVVGRAVGSIAGFGYSEGMAGKGGDWSPENLYAFLAKPKEWIPGTKMAFAGLSKSEDRANVIAYLSTLSN